MWLHPAFLDGCWDLNSNPRAYGAGTLQTTPSLQNLYFKAKHPLHGQQSACFSTLLHCGAARGPFSTTKIMSQVNHLAKVPALKSFVIGHTKQTRQHKMTKGQILLCSSIPISIYSLLNISRFLIMCIGICEWRTSNIRFPLKSCEPQSMGGGVAPWSSGRASALYR